MIADRRTRGRRARLAAPLVALLLGAAACGQDTSTSGWHLVEGTTALFWRCHGTHLIYWQNDGTNNGVAAIFQDDPLCPITAAPTVPAPTPSPR